MRHEITFGRIRGEVEATSQLQTIEGYPTKFFTFRFTHLFERTIDGASITLSHGTTPPQRVVKGSFYELLDSGTATLVIQNPLGKIEIHRPHPNSPYPIAVDEGSIMSWVNPTTEPSTVKEISCPGFSLCLLENLTPEQVPAAFREAIHRTFSISSQKNS